MFQSVAVTDEKTTHYNWFSIPESVIVVDDSENISDEEHVAANRVGDHDNDLVNSEQQEGNTMAGAEQAEKIHHKSGVCDECVGGTRKAG